jgi:pyruvate dehydrogenase E2 component (dihydrolipoamide acetyltransferase)
MAKNEIIMPQMGESITTGTITKWHKAPGDKIEADEILFEISTDKVESEIPSPFDGRMEELLFEEGDTVDVGKVIAFIEDDLSVPFGGGASTSSAKNASPSAAPVEPAATAPTQSAPVAQAHGEEVSGERKFYTPLVKKMAADHGVSLNELASITGTGSAGRVNKNDLQMYLRSQKGVTAVTEPTPKVSTPAPSAPAVKFDHGNRTEVIPMGNMRKAIAKNMMISKMTSPHVNSIDEIDFSNIVKFREGFKNEFFAKEGLKITYTHFILKAIILALKEHPMVNASIDGDNIIVKKDINLGCAVAVPGSGLVVPVIKNADTLNMTGLVRKLDELANKARARKLTMDEMTGGTFTFTNVGSFGTLLATPVILQPQLGIFAAGVIKKRVMVNPSDDSIGVKPMMYGTHTYDHRLIDGELGGLFLASVKRNLETMDPAGMF